MNFEIKQHFQIESARSLPHLDPAHPCSRIHGHSFKIILKLVGPLDKKLGWVMDYNEIVTKMKPIISRLDHCLLNEIPGLENPTTEIICRWIYENAKTNLPLLQNVTMMETSTTECTYPPG